jgi:hypothetical protein
MLADGLLVRFVPMVWASVLPNGLDSARRLVGWPGVVWRLALFCHFNQPVVLVFIAIALVGGLFLGYLFRPVRWLTWLAALGMIVINALILYVTLHAGLQATVEQSGLPIGF